MSSDQPTYRREGERRKRERKGENTDKNGLGAKVPGMTQPAAEVAASPPLAPARSHACPPTTELLPPMALVPCPLSLQHQGRRLGEHRKACHLPAGGNPALIPSPGSNRRRQGWALALLVAAELLTPLLRVLAMSLHPHNTFGLSPARPQCHRQPLTSPWPPGARVAEPCGLTGPWHCFPLLCLKVTIEAPFSLFFHNSLFLQFPFSLRKG